MQADLRPLLVGGNLMSRLNYILLMHRTQSRTFAYMINSWYAPDLVWQDIRDVLDPLQTLQTLKAGGRERENERD